jgi:bifunctional enzyme CysN/CysC
VNPTPALNAPTPPNRQAAPAEAPRAGTGAIPGHLFLVVVGHVDHGKSTLIGRLLFDTHSVPDGKTERIRAACKAEGMEFEYAFLLDALLEEQAQNITMDTTRVPFRTARRTFTIIDAPGHKEFLKNMITGAASADAAILIVDAQEGLREQTKRHGFLLSLLGLRQVVVAVNKMDLVDYDRTVFDRIRAELGEFLGKLGVTPSHYVPISARFGDGLLGPSERLAWYSGPALLPALEQFRATPPIENAPLRINVQDVYRFDARRIVAGFVVAGSVSVGDAVEFHPGGKRSRVKSIETWPVAAESRAPTGPVHAGRPVAVMLQDELYVERGQIGATPEEPPAEAHEFTGRLFWLHAEPLREGETVPLRLGTQQAEARVVSVLRTLDAVTLESGNGAATEVKRHEVAEVRLRVRRPLAFDPAGRIPALGRFVLMRGRRIAGGGVIDSAQLESATPASERSIKLSARTAMLGHRGAIIWLTGLSGSGKTTLAAALEKELFRVGVLPAVLDGDMLRKGLSKNLGFSDEDRKENLRRASELALHLADAGVVVIAALISPFRADRAAIAERARERGVSFAEVFVNAPLAECERRDPKQLYKRAREGQIPNFTGISSPYEAPLSPDLELRTDREPFEESVEKLTRLALGLARPSNQGSDTAGENI